MSKYSDFQTSFTDGVALSAALTEMGFPHETHAEAQTLYDYCGNARPQKAHIIIRRHNTGIDASNDIGFVRGADGKYQAIISEYDESVKFNASWLGELKQTYTEQRQMIMARNKGYVFQGREVVQTEKGKTVRLMFAAR